MDIGAFSRRVAEGAWRAFVNRGAWILPARQRMLSGVIYEGQGGQMGLENSPSLRRQE